MKSRFTIGDRWYAFIGRDRRGVRAAQSRPRAGRRAPSPGAAPTASRTYDLLAPADDVKRGYCSGAVKVADYVYALRPGGSLLSAAVRLSPAAKALFFRLPAGLRKPILTLAGR